MADPFAYTATGMDSPARNAIEITPSDSTDLPTVCRFLFIPDGVVCDHLTVTMAGGQTIPYRGIKPGWVPLSVSRVWATGTYVSGTIIGLW